jgi:hypothetical protein
MNPFVNRKVTYLFLANIFFLSGAIILGAVLQHVPQSATNLVLVFWIVFLAAELVAAVWLGNTIWRSEAQW